MKSVQIVVRRNVYDAANTEAHKKLRPATAFMVLTIVRNPSRLLISEFIGDSIWFQLTDEMSASASSFVSSLRIVTCAARPRP